MRVDYVPITEVIKDFVEDNDSTEVEIDEELLKKWALNVIELINTDQQLVHKIGLFDVRNYKVKKPEDFSMVCEVAYRLEPVKQTCSRQEQIVQWVQGTDSDCELEINVVCPKCKKTGCTECGQNTAIVDVDRIWEQSNAFLHHINKYSTVSRFGRGKSVYDPNFKLLRFAGGDWDGISRHFPNCMNLQETENHTYSFNPPNIELSFEKGEILLSYLAKKTDGKGDLMVPDHPTVYEAVLDYLTYKWHRKIYFKTKRSEDYRAYKDAQQMSEVSIGRSRSALQIPGFQEFSAWLRKNKYYRVNNAYDNLLNKGVGVYQDRYKDRDLYKR